MAILGIVNKQPREVLDFDISFVEFLKNRTDTLTSVTHEVVPAGLTVVYTAIDNQSVKCVISGGVDGQSYKVTLLTVTTAGLILEDEVNVMVQEV
jgi:hypothetical protein